MRCVWGWVGEGAYGAIGRQDAPPLTAGMSLIMSVWDNDMSGGGGRGGGPGSFP